MSDKFLRKISPAELSAMAKYKFSHFREVRALGGEEGSTLIGVPVSGSSLAHLGIVHGDFLVVRVTAEFRPENLYVWETPNGRTAKFGREQCAEIVLHNKAKWKETFSRSEVEMLGVVIKVERDLKVR